MKDKRVIIVIIIVLALVLGFSVYFVFTNVKKSDLITKDTLFLCKTDTEDYIGNTSHIELVKASDKKYEKDVCNGEFAGKYVCQNEYCDYYSIGGQFWGGYSDYEKGLAVIYDNDKEASFDNSFLYDFKNSKKLTEGLSFNMTIYNENKNNRTYFLVSKDGNEGVIDNSGKTIVDFKYDNVGFGMYHLENNSRSILLNYKGIIFLRLKDKLGIYDLEQEKLVTKINLDKIGYYSYDGEYVTPLLSELYSQVDNYNLNEIYVEEDKVGKIINYKTGEVVKTLNKTYDFVLPLDNELILVYENKITDILDKNNKSVLKEKIQGEANFNWTSGGGFELNEDTFKNIIITTKDKNYNFNIETRKLSEETNELITKDTLFFCSSNEEDGIGNSELVKASDGKHEKEVCNGNFAGKYVCQSSECRLKSNQYIGYLNNKGVGIITEGSDKDFLYDFINNKKLTDYYNFTYIVYSKNDISYFQVKNNKKYGIIDSNGKIIVPVKYNSLSLEDTSIEWQSDILLEKEGIIEAISDTGMSLIDLNTRKEIYNSKDKIIKSINGLSINFANLKLKQIYVASDKEGELINYKTGEVIKTFDKVYDMVYPINEKFILTIKDKEIDILEDNKSILKNKIKITSDYYYLNPDDENNIFNIEIRDYSNDTTIVYEFNIKTKELISKKK